MNSKQGIFITSLGVSGVVVIAWMHSLTYGMSFSQGLFVTLVLLGIFAITGAFLIGALEIYDALEEQEVSK